MDAGDARTVGARLLRIRLARRKSLRVVAGLAGMGKSKLSQIERGETALDSISDIVALANALQIAPSELITLPVPAPANGHTDSTIEAIRLAMDAIEVDRPEGLVLPVAALREQVTHIHRQRRACLTAEVATDLPALVRNLHTTLATGADHDEVLELGVYLHAHVTRWWLIEATASTDLIRRVMFLTRRLAQERDTVTMLGVAGMVVADTLLHSGAFAPGQAELDALTMPPTTAETAGLVAKITSLHAASAWLNGRPGDVAAPLGEVEELAGRFGTAGEADSTGYVHGPVDAANTRMSLALEAGDPDQVAGVARGVDPERHPFTVNRAHYWAVYGRALARLRGRQDDAVKALRRAEEIHPHRVQRDPFVREVLGELRGRVRPDSPAGRELRRMAYRAGLPA
ncbi:MAG TPA: helix-turn-helix transcriptional regulator [Pseudonocardiaceae bacterium]|nr:helix-turn-helix transcriptional regulator [Pseudonocardiaceae bacterium]